MKSVDAAELRATVRLLHCLQKERGISSVITLEKVRRSNRENVGGNLKIDPPEFLEEKFSDDEIHQEISNAIKNESDMINMSFELENYRNNTDNALSRFMARVADQSYFKTALKSIRMMTENRHIVRAFSSLITNIIHEQFENPYISFLEGEKNSLQKTSSHNRIAELDSMLASDPEPQFNDMRPFSWDGLVDSKVSSRRSSFSRNSKNGIFDGVPRTTGINIENGIRSKGVQDVVQGSIGGGIGKLLENYDKTENQKQQTDSPVLSSLMSLLLAFVKLKESKGIERSSLSSILKCSDPSNENENVAVNLRDLVMEIENQRSLIRGVRRKAMDVEEASGGSHQTSFLILTEESLELSPELSNIEDLIRDHFDTKAFKEAISFDGFWDLITAYMDKLHSLELLIIEEIETTVDDFLNTQNDDSNEPTSKTDKCLHSLLSSVNNPSGEFFNASETLDVLRSVPSENLKTSLMSYFDSCFQNSSSISKRKEAEDMRNQRKKSMDILENATLGFQKHEWEVNLDEVVFQKRVGRGGAGTTYLGNWRGQDVAIKVAAMTEIGVDGWTAEVQSLQLLHHNNIIRLMGSIYNPPPQPTRCLILEYCDAGDLGNALKSSVPPNFVFHVAQSMSNGLSYLHHKGILHRDIKPENVLLHGDVTQGKFVVKLTDFGLSTKLRFDGDREHSAETGTYRWMAPEIIRHEDYSHEADVYSYSLVVWQLLTHEDPFAGSTQIEAAQYVAMNGSRPPFPRDTPTGIQNIIQRGWTEDPASRPSFEQICHMLQELNDGLSDNDADWLKAPYGHPVYEPDMLTASSHKRVNKLQELQHPKLQKRKGNRKKFHVKGLFGRK